MALALACASNWLVVVAWPVSNGAAARLFNFVAVDGDGLGTLARCPILLCAVVAAATNSAAASRVLAVFFLDIECWVRVGYARTLPWPSRTSFGHKSP